MTTIWNLPRIDIQSLAAIQEERPTALLTGSTAWENVGGMLDLPLVIQAEPRSAQRDFLDSLVEGLPPQVEVIYAVGGV